MDIKIYLNLIQLNRIFPQKKTSAAAQEIPRKITSNLT